MIMYMYHGKNVFVLKIHNQPRLTNFQLLVALLTFETKQPQ